MNKAITLVIPAAGSGLRLDPKNPKQFLEHRGLKTLEWTLKAFEPIAQRLKKVIICLPEAYVNRIELQHPLSDVSQTLGGETRQESVYLGLQYLAKQDVLNNSHCLVHDAARPLLSSKDLNQLIDTLDKNNEAALLATPVKDTLKRSTPNQSVETTVDRANLWQAQTPQAAPGEIMLAAYKKAMEQGWQVTDDASILEQAGYPVHLVPSSDPNFKITQNQDWEIFKKLV